MSQGETAAPDRYARIVVGIVAAVAAAMSLFHMYVIVVGPPEAQVFRAIHLTFAVTLVFLIYPTTGGHPPARPAPWDLALLAIAIGGTGYVLLNYQYLVDRIPYIDDPSRVDLVLGTLMVLIVLEGTRRLLGLALPLTTVAFLIYALFFTDIEYPRLIDQLFLTTEGIFGPTLGVSASYVLIFVLFGSFMERTGTGQLFMDFALSLTGHTAGGPGKVAVVSSSLFGTISGSAVANVMVDGPITIPLMKRTGFRPPFAAGVESVASTGGQIMPPIMGAAAFVMAEFLGVSYLQVATWAAIPALLYYIACFGAVHFEAKRCGLLGLPRAECPRLGAVLAERGHLFIPVIIILTVMFSGYTAPLAALAGTIACFPVAMLRRSTRRDLKLVMVWEALVEGAKNALSVAMACACAGIVIGIIALTGIGISFTQIILAIAQNSLLLALVVTAIAGIVLGMGMPTTPAYIIMTALLVPALVKLGAVIPAAHMFAFYFAILSAITPPVALAVFAAASLAKADLWKSGWAAVRIGAAGFIVPFMFVYEPALLTEGEWPRIVGASVTAVIGCLGLAAGLHGYFLRRCALWECVVIVAGSLLLIDPGPITDLLGFGTLAAMAGYQYWTRRRDAVPAKPQSVPVKAP